MELGTTPGRTGSRFVPGASEHVAAEKPAPTRKRYRERAAEAIEGLDLLITPTLAFVAPPAIRDDREIRDAVIRLTYPFNALGWPALAMPCGPAEHRLPASVQLVAPAGEDARVIAASARLEQALAPRLGPTAQTGC